RIETKQKEMDLHTLSFSKEVEEVFFSFYEQFSEKNIEVAFAEHSINTTVLADPLMLLRVLQNIIQNLLRYADGQAKVTFSKEDPFIRLTVANPIKPGTQTSVEKVFQRFYTENTSRTNTESSGIGLYLSKKLVEGMGGEMTARLDGGIFSISVKLRRV
ncbi:TPA: HAMP domain-containing histidine kinase, partial [Enterococcus faecium]|nr:HAMP domain-containing histidine kinase [Enterococcus faecium]